MPWLLLLALHAPAPFLGQRLDGKVPDPSRLRPGEVVWIVCGLHLEVEDWTVSPDGSRLERLDAPKWNGDRDLWYQAMHPSLVAWTSRQAAGRHLARMKAAGAKRWRDIAR